ncbi:MAG: YqaA family protein [Candidatus Kapaibacterium sp.]
MHDLDGYIRSYGGMGLLVISFIAATIFPLSSELALAAALRLGMPPMESLLYASLGNSLGVIFNYGLGRWGSETVLKKTLASRAGRRAQGWTERYGKWTLLLSWLPIIGDPLTLLAGVARVNFLFFLIVSSGVRVARYGVIIALM